MSTNRKYDALACLLVENVLSVADATESGGDNCYDHQGKHKQPGSTPKKARKRKQHMYQQHRRGSSLKFEKLEGEAINEGPFYQLEYTLLCAITLVMKQTSQDYPPSRRLSCLMTLFQK